MNSLELIGIVECVKPDSPGDYVFLYTDDDDTYVLQLTVQQRGAINPYLNAKKHLEITGTLLNDPNRYGTWIEVQSFKEA